MRYFSFKNPLLLLATLGLFACSSTPTSLTLSPEITVSSAEKTAQSTNNWLLSSQDLRTARYLISISSGDDVATLINESTSTREVVEQTLKTHWFKQGHQFNNNKNNDHTLEILLVKSLAEVEQASFSHESDINVVIKVQLSTDKGTFSKTFRAHYEEKAPFSADVTKIATQLNIQLSQLLDQIVQDPELNAKLLQL